MSAPEYFKREAAPDYFQRENEEPQPPALKVPRPGDDKEGGGFVGDIGQAATLGAHYARHAGYGLGDKVMAGLMAADDVAHKDRAGGVSLAHPVDTGRALFNAAKHLVRPGDNALSDAYQRDLSFNDKTLEENDKHYKGARWAGNLLGFGTSVAAPFLATKAVQATTQGLRALGLLKAAQPAAEVATEAAPVVARGLKQLVRAGAVQGAKAGAVQGGLNAYGEDRSDNVGDTLLHTGAGAVFGAGLGGAAGAVTPLVATGGAKLLSKFANKRAVKAIGAIQKDLKQMRPEDVQALGEELYRKGIIKPWSSKAGLYQAVQEHLNKAGGMMDSALADADAAAPFGVNPEKFQSAAQAVVEENKLNPLRKAAAQSAYDQGVAELGKDGIVPFKIAHQVESDFNKNLYGKLEAPLKVKGARQVGHALDQELERQIGEAAGPDVLQRFQQAKAEYGPMATAFKFAKAGMDRGEGNHAISLHDVGGFTAGFAATHDPVKAALTGLGVHLAKGYGNQVLGSTANAIAKALPYVARAAAPVSSVEGPAVADAANPYLQALLEGLRRRQSVVPAAIPATPEMLTEREH
jgi:hypothetical protein